MSLVTGLTAFAQAVAADIKAIGLAVAVKLSPNRTYTDTATSGDAAQEKLSLFIQPTGDTTRVSTGSQVEVTYNSNNKILVGGYAVGRKTTMLVGGAGAKDKIVVDMNQTNVSGAGLIDKVLSYEAVISSIAANTFLKGYAAYYVPNLSQVPNIGNIATFYAFSCDHVDAIIQHAGTIINPVGAQYAPTFHLGLRPGRYYSAPYNVLAATQYAANTIYLSNVYVPHRAGIIELGFTVTAAGTATKARMGLYQVANGAIIARARTSEIDVTAPGNKSGAIRVKADSGTYFIALILNGTCTINGESIEGASGPAATLSAMWGSASPTDAGAAIKTWLAGYPYGELPSDPLPFTNLTSSTTVTNPHLWFRV